MKKILLPLLLVLLALSVFAEVDETEDVYEGIQDVELQGSAGLTPDSTFYFLETAVESILVGDNPETALKYKEEKVLELKEMIASDNKEAAQKALAGVEKYNKIIEKEVSPDIEQRVRESSKAVKGVLQSFDLEGEEWDDLEEEIDKTVEKEDKIALAAKVSKKIKDLCEELARLDPLQYDRTCKTDEDAPRWQRQLDEDLTKEQREEAEEFFVTLSQCFDNPRECPCSEFKIKKFADACAEIAPLAAACDIDGDEEACDKMDALPDPIDLLPEHLQDAMDAVEDRYRDSEFDHHVPRECKEAGANDQKSCMKIMFKIHAPEECQQALEDGTIDISNEREARKACEAIMFKLDAPQECVEAGLTDHRACGVFMFKLEAPQECLDAGITGEGRDDWKKCEVIRFQIDSPPECMEAGLTGEGRDDWKKCDAIRFRLDAPQECLDAGITGEARDDWKKCEKIKFLLDSPQECIDAGITGEGRDDWKKCDAIRFKLDEPDCVAAGIDPNDRKAHDKCQLIKFKRDAPQECLDAGFDGSGRNDWRECDKIKFKLDAPPECIAAGLDGSSSRDWDKCNKIRGEDDDGPGREDCREDQLHICDDGFCKCVDKEDSVDCATLYCPSGSECIQGIGCQVTEESQCKDGCEQECPGASKTECVENGMICECYYDKTDSCEGVQCESGSVCSGGECISTIAPPEDPCDFIECPSGEYCHEGSCMSTDPEPPKSDPIPEPKPKPTPEPEPESSEPESSEPESSEPDSVTGEVVLDNDFLKYYYR